MHIHSVFRETRRLRDFLNVQVLDKPQKKDRTLPLGQSLRRFPNRLDLFVDRSLLFGRNAPIGPIVNLVLPDAMRLFPKLEAAVPCVIANQIDGDSQKPCIDAAVSSKPGPAAIGLPKAILRQRLGRVLIAYRRSRAERIPLTSVAPPARPESSNFRIAIAGV